MATVLRLITAVTALGAAGCGGLVARLGVGPRIDGEGHVGVEVFVTQGFRAGDSALWPIATVRAGRAGASHRASAGVAAGLELGRASRLGRPSPVEDLALPARLGLRGGLAVALDRTAGATTGSVELAAGSSYPIAPVRRADLGLGLELACATQLTADRAVAARLSCRPALVIELTNRWQPPAQVY